MAVQPQVNYYYKQDTNQILVGSEGNTIVNVSDMNALLTSSKNFPITDLNTVAKIKSIGQAITYQSSAVYNSASFSAGNPGFSIPIEDDQELWIYRGIQPANTTPVGTPTDAGPGDSNHTQYNAYLHRPYKLYMLTETGSGVGTQPFLPVGKIFNEGTATNNGIIPFNNVYNVKQQGIVGNLDQPNNQFLVSQSFSSGSFSIIDGQRQIRPWVYTKYSSLGTPPVVGSLWNIYLETSEVEGRGANAHADKNWNTSIAGGDPTNAKVAANNATAASVTSITYNTGQSGTGLNLSLVISNISQSGNAGKPMGQIVLSEVGFTNNSAAYTIASMAESPDYWTFTVNTPQINGTWPPANNAAISASFNGAQLIGKVSQEQTTQLNTNPLFSNSVKFFEGEWSFTSSDFDTTSADGTAATGSCQFGLWAQLDTYVEYKATVNINNNQPVRLDYTGSTGVPNFSIINEGFNATFIALPGTVSASDDVSSQTFTLELNSPTAAGTAPIDIYSSRISDVYLSLSSSLSESIDGLYVFNQLPTEDIYVTASMLLNAWTGSDDGAKYDDASSTYAISPATPVYGEGEEGDGTSWPTASINIYKGNYPTNVPKESDSPLHTEEFITLGGDYGNNGVAITTSFVLPSSSITFQDCLNLSLSVTSGSDLASLVQNSLVVSEYTLEFNNAASQEGGDGRVPTFIDNSYKGTDGFSNAPECQPLLNNVVQERNNKNIQLVEYQTDPYDPTNFQQILSGSARKSTVPESNYTTDSWLNNRYVGSFTTAYNYNSIIGLEGGFGNSPVIDYKRAYLAYCDQVTDPYPVVNSKTQFNILYMINAGGDALNPLLSEYTAFDVLGTWDEGGLGQVGINQVSGSTQFDALNGFQSTFKVGKQAIPLLYSQTSANDFAQAIPIAGNAEQISNVTSSYIEYDMTSQGSNKLSQEQNAINVNYFNIAQGIATQTTQIMPQVPGAFDSTRFTISSGSGWGVKRANPDVNGVIELPIITSSIATPYTAPTDVFGTEYFGNPGEVFFTADPLGSGSTDLSDDYQIRGTFVQPSTFPSRYKTKKFVKKQNKKKTKYKAGDVGTVSFRFESTTNTDLELGTAQWTDEPFQWLSNASPQGYQEPTMTFYFGDIDGTPNGDIAVVPLWSLSDNVGFNAQKTEYTYEVEANDIENYLSGAGYTVGKVQYVTYDFAFESNVDLVSGRRYRFQMVGEYDTEVGGLDGSGQTGEAQRNRFNPTYLPQFSDGASGGSNSNPVPYTTNIPSDGPYVSMNVIGGQAASSLQSNALNFPYWNFTSGSSAANEFQYQMRNNSTPFDQTSIISEPPVGQIMWNNASGSLRLTPNNSQTWNAARNAVTATNQTTRFLYPQTTSGKGQVFGNLFGISSDGITITNATLSSNLATANGFVAGDTITFEKLYLENAGFGTVNTDLVFTLTSDYTINNQEGSNQIALRTTAANGSALAILTNLETATGASQPLGTMYAQVVGNSNRSWTGTISAVDVDASNNWATISFFNDLQNGGNVSYYANPFANTDDVVVSFTEGSPTGTVTLQNTILELQSPNGNNSYGLGYYQGYLPYTASANNNFPGGLEPQDTAWPLPNVPYEFRINDEIRFQNDERYSYKVITVLTPQQNFIINGIDKLRLTVDRPIASSIDLNFFLIRRYVDAPNSVIVDRVFPYGSLPTVKEFVSSDNNILTYNDGTGPSTGANATGSTTIMETSGSFIEYIKPLLKSDNTPSGILKPEYPIIELEVTPDEVIRDLRDKKLIE